MKTAYKFRMYPNRQQETIFRSDSRYVPKLMLSKIGSVRIFIHREIEGKIKTCTIKKDNLGKLYAILVSELEDVPSIKPKTAIGVDVGLTNLVMLSTGESIQYPKCYIETEKKLAAVQRDLSRKHKGSKNRKKARLKVAKVHQRITNLRAEFLYKVSRKLWIQQT